MLGGPAQAESLRGGALARQVNTVTSLLDASKYEV
jgi:hypothetical protein